MIDWLSFEQILGYVASIILLLGYAIKSDVKTKTVLTFSSIFFAWHFFLLGAFTATAICTINALRNVSSIFLFKSKMVFLIFAGLYGVFSYLTYSHPIDILPAIGAFITCIGMFLLGGIRFRMLVVIATTLWTIHNIYVGSIGGTINTVILFFISSMTVLRLYRENKNLENDQNT